MKRRAGKETRGHGDAGKIFFVSGILVMILWTGGCGPNASIVNSGASTPPTPPVTGERPASTFEKDLEAMRTANFEFIFALRRKDGGKLDTDDKRFIKANSPENNRNILSDDDKALLAGSNFPIPPERLKALQDRFDFKDYSATPMPISNSNVNTNVNPRVRKVAPVE